jgi:hypothetical protein
VRGLGLTPAQFWSLSLKELWLERRYARQKHQDERDRDLVLAWQIMRIKIRSMKPKGALQLPKLGSLLAEGRPTPEGPAGQKAALYQLSAALGVPIVRRRRE